MSLKNFKKMENGIFSIILGLLVTLFLVFLLTIHHLYQFKKKSVYTTFYKNSYYDLFLKTTKTLEKKKLFSFQNNHFYGYGITNIFITYQNVLYSLKDVLEKNLLTTDDLLNSFTLVSQNDKIKLYQYKTYTITVSYLLDDYCEITFSES